MVCTRGDPAAAAGAPASPPRVPPSATPPPAGPRSAGSAAGTRHAWGTGALRLGGRAYFWVCTGLGSQSTLGTHAACTGDRPPAAGLGPTCDALGLLHGSRRLGGPLCLGWLACMGQTQRNGQRVVRGRGAAGGERAAAAAPRRRQRAACPAGAPATCSAMRAEPAGLPWTSGAGGARASDVPSRGARLACQPHLPGPRQPSRAAAGRRQQGGPPPLGLRRRPPCSPCALEAPALWPWLCWMALRLQVRGWACSGLRPAAPVTDPMQRQRSGGEVQGAFWWTLGGAHSAQRASERAIQGTEQSRTHPAISNPKQSGGASRAAGGGAGAGVMAALGSNWPLHASS